MIYTLDETAVYIIVTLVLVAVQLYQQRLISNLQKDTRRLWEHAATTAILVFSKLEQLEKQLKEKE